MSGDYVTTIKLVIYKGLVNGHIAVQLIILKLQIEFIILPREQAIELSPDYGRHKEQTHPNNI